MSFSRGGYVRFGYAAPRGSGGYTVWQPDHWALAGTDLRYGDLLGAEPVVVGYEADGCELALVRRSAGADRERRHAAGLPGGRHVAGPPLVGHGGRQRAAAPERHPPGLPADLEYVSLRLLGDMEPAHTARLAKGHAVMGAFPVPGGGEVFTTGCTDWAHGLGDRPDSGVDDGHAQRAGSLRAPRLNRRLGVTTGPAPAPRPACADGGGRGAGCDGTSAGYLARR